MRPRRRLLPTGLAALQADRTSRLAPERRDEARAAGNARPPSASDHWRFWRQAEMRADASRNQALNLASVPVGAKNTAICAIRPPRGTFWTHLDEHLFPRLLPRGWCLVVTALILAGRCVLPFRPRARPNGARVAAGVGAALRLWTGCLPTLTRPASFRPPAYARRRGSSVVAGVRPDARAGLAGHVCAVHGGRRDVATYAVEKGDRGAISPGGATAGSEGRERPTRT